LCRLASASSRPFSSISWNSRAFWIARTDCAAKVCSRSMVFLANSPGSLRLASGRRASSGSAAHLAQHTHTRDRPGCQGRGPSAAQEQHAPRCCGVSRGIRTGFFFPSPDAAPDYLSQFHEHYSPKLAAAIEAWKAVSTDPDRKVGKTVKQALIVWLRQHANDFGLPLMDSNNDPRIQSATSCR
jgi:hypothetical protein